MAEADGQRVEELIVSTLQMTDALAKLMIKKGLITEAEFKKKLAFRNAKGHRAEWGSGAAPLLAISPQWWSAF